MGDLTSKTVLLFFSNKKRVLQLDYDPSIFLNNLYRLTSFQCSLSCNMVGIHNGQPKQMGLKELLQGIVVGLDNLDAVIRILRESSSNAIASSGLRSGELP
ncbi:DNA gyrase subunit A, chloroplastic/mitochondrial-like [Prunus avium]|uniref:DNA gyrase subunit A, chloroplastic/mitochondrial-like n=1 Tax=Prunus avium TaxID=42229 RepID=A0A6P5TJS8_PRUAV|nr:DNA gyrase subunit A, chloroplastic/mitochondrial-like [Prunus avium]